MTVLQFVFLFFRHLTTRNITITQRNGLAAATKLIVYGITNLEKISYNVEIDRNSVEYAGLFVFRSFLAMKPTGSKGGV